MFGFHDGQTEAPKIQAQKVITVHNVLSKLLVNEVISLKTFQSTQIKTSFHLYLGSRSLLGN